MHNEKKRAIRNSGNCFQVLEGVRGNFSKEVPPHRVPASLLHFLIRQRRADDGGELRQLGDQEFDPEGGFEIFKHSRYRGKGGQVARQHHVLDLEIPRGKDR